MGVRGVLVRALRCHRYDRNLSEDVVVGYWFSRCGSFSLHDIACRIIELDRKNPNDPKGVRNKFTP